MSEHVGLQIECHRMWNKKVQVISNINKSNRGHWKKPIKKYLQKTPDQHNIYKLQRSAILQTTHILRKVLSIKPD